MKIIVPVLFALAILFACEKKEDPVVTAISLDKTELTLKAGEKYQFKVSHTPSEAKAPQYKWAVEVFAGSPTSIAEINQDGTLTAIKDGEAIVTVETVDIVSSLGIPLMAVCDLVIEPVKAEGVKLNKNSITLDPGTSETLTYVISPENTTDKDVSWASSNSEIATVNNGVVKALSAGEVSITVTVRNTTAKDVCKVKVNPSKLEGLALSDKSKTVLQGESFKLTPMFTPEYATNKNIKWSSSNEKIALVDSEGNVKTIGFGECSIKAISEDGEFEASCKVIVKPIPVQGIRFENYEYKVEIGTERQLNVIVLPENAGNKEIIWSSSNDIIAPIDQKGVVKGNITGRATITAKSVDGGFEARCDLQVAGVNEFIYLYFQSASVVIMNGYLTGSIYSAIRNNSSKEITLTKFKIIDSNTWKAVAETTDASQLGNLSPGQTTNLGGRLNSVYEPIFVWEFTCNGVEYRRQIKYGDNTPYSSTLQTKGNADNLIDLARSEK